jgi:hypothetical protein
MSILFLGLTLPATLLDPTRDPVPNGQKVAHSSHCAGCHGYDETGLALVDSEGNDVSIFDDWQISMMGLSAYDPFWRATISHEVSQYPAAKSAIESTCLKCHAPLGIIQAHLDGRPYSYELMLQDSLGLDGISCSACHQQPSQNLGKGHSGNFTIDTNRVLFGQFPNPFQGPMQIYVGFEPKFSDHIYSSGVCAGCHTLITETLHQDGSPTGNFFVEQATYHEWLNSSYPEQGKECQTCHLPFISDGVVIATDFNVLEKRKPFGLHQYFGANTAMLDLMKANRVLLGLPEDPPEQAWDESIANNRKSLSNAAELTIPAVTIDNDTLYFTVQVKNKSGHKFPSGFPSRLAWLQIILKDENGQDTLYANGLLNAQGKISERNFPYEPHHQVSTSSEDVQIYEMVMGDMDGQLTTRLNAAFEPLKDNRLLPLGFKTDHLTYDTVAVWGGANQDPEYTSGSALGLDLIEYRIPLQGNNGVADLDVSLHYQTLPSRWMNDLFEHDSIAQVAQFKSMFQNYTTFHELIDRVHIDSIDLSPSAINPIESITSLELFPNPLTGTTLHVSLTSHMPTTNGLRFEIVTSFGALIQKGDFTQRIVIDRSLTKGVYFFILSDGPSRIKCMKPFVVL